MGRLTEKDEYGNWCLRGVTWASLGVGKTITEDVWEGLYGALWKLMEYEDTGVSPEQLEVIDEEYRKMAEELARLRKETGGGGDGAGGVKAVHKPEG